MHTKGKNIDTGKKQKPQIFIKEITFNDGTKINLNHSSIIVFTGSNNCGKSQVLKDIEYDLDDSILLSPIVLKGVSYDFLGEIDETKFFEENFYLNQRGYYQAYETSDYFQLDSLKSNWKDARLYGGIHRLFIKRLGTEDRLIASNELQRNKNPERHPIYKLYKKEAIVSKLSDYFRQAFCCDLVINRNKLQTIPLHVGQAPNQKEFTIDIQDDYYNRVEKLPKLQEQGDGMRSFAGILLDTFTSEYTVTLIDEPEAFLHPPQARMLGKMLAKNNSNERQLFIATHSEDFLQGLIDADNDNVTVIRINRKDNINKMSILRNSEIKKLWSNPILRYSNILSGLFHEKVVVCESDYDCLFYQAVMNAIYEQKEEIAPDILFTHCGGKGRAKDIVAALKAVNVPVVAICDFDLLNESQNFKPLVSSFCIDWKDKLSDYMKTIYDSMNAKCSSGIDAWGNVKKSGKAGLSGDEPAAYENVESICKSAGLFIVPVGEMECFDRTINKEKKEWVYHVLENYDLAKEPKLEDARKFIQEVVNYRLV